MKRVIIARRDGKISMKVVMDINKCCIVEEILELTEIVTRSVRFVF